MPMPEIFQHSEERRLFYVALTRAKHAVYLLGGMHTPSSFLTELQIYAPSNSISHASRNENTEKEIQSCPKCNVGQLQITQGKYGIFLGCSEYPVCKYTQK
jgi:DNA helicase-4